MSERSRLRVGFFQVLRVATTPTGLRCIILNTSYEGIPHEIPPISSNRLKRYLPRSFTALDDDFTLAEQFL